MSPAVFAGNAIEADLAAVYSPSYAASVGGDDNAQVIIANTVVGSNQIQDQSGTGAHMRIAGFYMATNDLINATTTGGMVGWLSGNNANVQDALAFGTSVGADLLVYICQYSDSASIAGVSQQPGMFSALNPGAVWSGVFAHETGGHAYGRSHSDGVLNPKTIMLHNYCGGGAAPPYFYTNPNIWFNTVQLVGDGINNCSMGALVNAGDNSSCSAQAVADRRARVIVGPNLNNVVLHWSFTNAPGSAPASTTNYDTVSGAPAVVRGIGATYTGNALRIPGATTGNTAANSISAYIDLPNGIISSRTNITIEIWATPLSAPNWARLFDFGRPSQAGDGLGASGEYTGAPGSAAPGTTSSQDDIMLSMAIGTDITMQRFEAKLSGTATTLDANLATTTNVQHHYAITFTDGAGAAGSLGGRWQWFRDGDPVAYLDISNHLSGIQDVNNWLGRSMWSGDNNANNDYAEVRISTVAMSRGQILANYLLGPNYVPAATVTLTNSDASGASSFNAAGQWSNAATPSGANSYETFDYQMLTPATVIGYTFGGGSLKLSGGTLVWAGTGSSTITVNNLVLNGGTVRNSGSGTCTLAGALLTTTNGGIFNAVSGALTISSAISGNGPLTFLANTVTLAGNNSAFTGKMFVGNGMPGAVAMESQSRLGASPTNFIPDALDMNRGTLQTTATFSLNDTNRGILLDVSGGTFNVASGTTLTLSSTLSTPATASGIVVGSLTKAAAGTLILNSTSNTFKGTLNVDTGSTTANDGIVKVANNQVLANAHSPIFIRNNNSGVSTLQLDGTTGNISLSQGVSANCRSGSTATIENVAGTNSINGTIALNTGGNLFNIQSDAGLLVFKGTNQYIGSLTGGRIYAFSGAGDFLVSGPIFNSTNTAPISLTKSGAGTLTLGGTNTYANGTTLSGGTLLVNGSITGAVSVAGSTTLGGRGTIFSAVTIPSGATLAPGTNSISIGTLTVTNSVTLQSGSTTRMKISRSPLTNDVLRVTGTSGAVTYGGALVVTNLAGTLAAGDSFKLFNATGYSGSFSSTNLPPLSAGLVWNTNGLITSGTLGVVALDFGIDSTPVSSATQIGGSATYNVTITASNGFSGGVALSVSGLPAGCSASFSPASVTGSGSSTLTIITSNSIAVGNYPLTITGTNSDFSRTHSAITTLSVNDFTVAATPASQTIFAGNGTNFTVNVGVLNGFSGTVALSVGGLPAGANYTLSQTNVSGSGAVTLSVTTTETVPTNNYLLTINGASGSLARSAQINLIVQHLPANLSWNSFFAGDWDIVVSTNWLDTNTIANAFFYQGDTVFFGDTPGVVTNINLGAGIVVNPAGVIVDAAVNNYTISGAGKISGATGLVKRGGSTLTLGTTNDFTGTSIIESGILALANGGSLDGSAAIRINTGAILDVNSRVDGVLTLGSGQTLQGNGAVSGSVVANSGATLAPGTNSIGTLAISNSLTLQDGSTNRFELDKSSVATNDQLLVAGTLNYGGNLFVTNLAGTLAAGDSFKLFNAANYIGTFTATNLPALTSGLSWSNTLASDGTLRIIGAAQPPVIPGVALSGNNFTLSIAGGSPGTPYRVLGTTNIALPVSAWTPLWTNVFDDGGNGSFTNIVLPSSLQQFYQIAVP